MSNDENVKRYLSKLINTIDFNKLKNCGRGEIYIDVIDISELPKKLAWELLYPIAEEMALGKKLDPNLKIAKNLYLRRPVLFYSLEDFLFDEIFEGYEADVEEYEKEKSEGKDTFICEDDMIFVFDAKEKKEYVFDISYARERKTNKDKEGLAWLTEKIYQYLIKNGEKIMLFYKEE